MSDKYSFAKCEQYGRRLASRLCDQYFSTAPDAALDGPAVLQFTPIRQVNLLVVRQLLHQWQAEISRLRSPFFDFEAPAVQVALTQFQNTLSRYIRLTRPAFEPLLAQAIAEALLLVTNPSSAFARFFLDQQSDTTQSHLRSELRYLDLNKDFFAAFIATLPADQPLSPSTVLAQLQAYQSLNYRLHQPVQSLVASLSDLLPLTEADLREDGPSSASALNSTAPLPATARTGNDTSIPSPLHATASPPVLPTQTSIHSPTPHEQRQPNSPAETPLHEKLKAHQPASAPLAVTLRATQPASTSPLAERNAPKVETLREAISINQRFSFINELFNGENMEYHAAIQHLDSLADQEQARQYITQNLAQRYDWKRKEEHVAKLLKLLERRYPSN